MDAVFFAGVIELLLHFGEDFGVGRILMNGLHFLRVFLHVEELVFLGFGNPEEFVVGGADAIVSGDGVSALARVAVVDGVTPAAGCFARGFEKREERFPLHRAGDFGSGGLEKGGGVVDVLDEGLGN